MVYQGEIDIQTPVEDAFELQEHCKSLGKDIEVFHTYPDLGHGFSPNVGISKWRKTVGPIEDRVVQDIADDLLKRFGT